MEIEEIRRRMLTSKGKVCVVDVSESSSFPGYIRTIGIRAESVVDIDYEQWGYDEGGAYFTAKYPSLDDAVSAVEQFLGTKYGDWPSLPAYPECAAGQAAEGHAHLTMAIATGTVPLPAGAAWRLGAGYWSKFRT
ncbi:hypothetical protein HUA78_45615 [Myxococcus sp. CA033]|uniref:hypothetical protein n=1 Tax=Myxococcus sp. CA033 TaxID=2741516 RepID=UPI00157B7119|nr:hypothetical protein [Myxococcus sp. CA033]NTX41721.1 hypothetical protein [Myxococcus sp. CA033]